MNTNYKTIQRSKTYLQAQAHADTTALQIIHHLNCIEAFRNRDEDTWGAIGTLNSINAKLDEVLAEIVAYHDLRVAEENR